VAPEDAARIAVDPRMMAHVATHHGYSVQRWAPYVDLVVRWNDGSKLVQRSPLAADEDRVASFEVPTGIHEKELMLFFSELFAAISIRSIRLRCLRTGESLWVGDPGNGFEGVRIHGKARRLKGDDAFHVLRTTDVPIVLLPRASASLCDRPLRVEVTACVASSLGELELA
jgi:hypothetical protein